MICLEGCSLESSWEATRLGQILPYLYIKLNIYQRYVSSRRHRARDDGKPFVPTWVDAPEVARFAWRCGCKGGWFVMRFDTVSIFTRRQSNMTCHGGISVQPMSPASILLESWGDQGCRLPVLTSKLLWSANHHVQPQAERFTAGMKMANQFVRLDCNACWLESVIRP